MAEIKAYSVVAAKQVVALRGGQGSRRRGGVVFSGKPVVVSLGSGVGVDHVVSVKDLEEILADGHLRHREVVVEVVALKDVDAGGKPVTTKVAKTRAVTKPAAGNKKAAAQATKAAKSELAAKAKADAEAKAKADAEAKARAEEEAAKGKGA